MDDQVEKQNLIVTGSNLPVRSWSEDYRDLFFLLGVNTENEMAVINSKKLTAGNYCSILPPSRFLPDYWIRMIDDNH